MICPKCGKEAGNSKFCPECGNPMDSSDNFNNVKETTLQADDLSNKTDDNINKSMDQDTDKNGETYYDALKRIEDEKEEKQKKKKKNRRIGCFGFILLIVIITVTSVLVSNFKEKKEGNNSEISSTIDSESNADVSVDAKELEKEIDELTKIKMSLIFGYSLNPVKEKYNNASENVKNAVNNSDKLAEIEREYKKMIEKEGDAVKNNFTSEYDNVEKTTWYYPKNMPEYIDERSYAIPYVGQKGNEIYLFIRWNYTGERYIFYNQIKVSTDNATYPVMFHSYDVKRDSSEYGTVNETLDQYINQDFGTPESAYVPMLFDMINSNSTIVRFQGDSKSFDLTVTESDKKAIKDAISYLIYLEEKQK